MSLSSAGPWGWLANAPGEPAVGSQQGSCHPVPGVRCNCLPEVTGRREGALLALPFSSALPNASHCVLSVSNK